MNVFGMLFQEHGQLHFATLIKLNFTPQTPTPFPTNFSQESLFPHTNHIFPKRYSILHQNPSDFINYPKTLPFTAELLLLILM